MAREKLGNPQAAIFVAYAILVILLCLLP